MSDKLDPKECGPQCMHDYELGVLYRFVKFKGADSSGALGTDFAYCLLILSAFGRRFVCRQSVIGR